MSLKETQYLTTSSKQSFSGLCHYVHANACGLGDQKLSPKLRELQFLCFKAGGERHGTPLTTHWASAPPICHRLTHMCRWLDAATDSDQQTFLSGSRYHRPRRRKKTKKPVM